MTRFALVLLPDFISDATTAGSVARLRLLESAQDQIQLGRQLLD